MLVLCVNYQLLEALVCERLYIPWGEAFRPDGQVGPPVSNLDLLVVLQDLSCSWYLCFWNNSLLMICFSVIFLQLNRYRALIRKKSGCLRRLAACAFLHPCYIAHVSQKAVGLATCCDKAFLKATETCGHVFPLILYNLGRRNLMKLCGRCLYKVVALLLPFS